VMMRKVTRFAMDVGAVLLGGRSGLCGRGAQASGTHSTGDYLGLWSLVLPAGLALVPFAMGFAAEPEGPVYVSNFIWPNASRSALPPCRLWC
jgi:hypothetical protein